MVVVGGGIIGLELGSVWSRLGAQVTVVEYMNAIGAGMDSAIATAFQKILAKQGLKFRLGTKVTGASVKGAQVELDVESADGSTKDKV